MKLVFFMYLEEDESHVLRLLQEHQVVVYSHLPIEGHGPGMEGWYGEVAPYASRMTFTILPADKARGLLDAVSSGQEGVSDPMHPIHAMQVDVEAVARSGVPVVWDPGRAPEA
jgi:hypothetical protein